MREYAKGTFLKLVSLEFLTINYYDNYVRIMISYKNIKKILFYFSVDCSENMYVKKYFFQINTFSKDIFSKFTFFFNIFFKYFFLHIFAIARHCL